MIIPLKCPKCGSKHVSRHQNPQLPAKAHQLFCGKCGLHVSARTEMEANTAWAAKSRRTI